MLINVCQTKECRVLSKCPYLIDLLARTIYDKRKTGNNTPKRIAQQQGLLILLWAGRQFVYQLAR